MKVVIADAKKGMTYQVELDKVKSKPLFGQRLGAEIDGSLVSLPGFKLKITGGADSDGFPMRHDLQGLERKRVLLAGKPGFRPVEKGERQKKTIRGNTVAEDIAQLNLKITAYGEKPVFEVLGVPEKQRKPREQGGQVKPVEAVPAVSAQ